MSKSAAYMTGQAQLIYSCRTHHKNIDLCATPLLALFRAKQSFHGLRLGISGVLMIASRTVLVAQQLRTGSITTKVAV